MYVRFFCVFREGYMSEKHSHTCVILFLFLLLVLIPYETQLFFFYFFYKVDSWVWGELGIEGVRELGS